MEIEGAVAKVLTGPTGGIFKIWDINGLFWPRFPDYPNLPMSPQKIRSVEARENDVFICSYPRSGLHWVWEIVLMIQLGTTEPAQRILESQMIENQRSLQAIAELKSPRVFPTHLRFNEVPTSFVDKKCKFIYIMRDPRAVALSYYRMFSAFSTESGMHFDGSWEDFLPMFIQNQVPFNGWFEMQKSWEKVILEHPDHPIYVVEFENLKKDIVSEVQKLANFLNGDSSTEFCSAVAASTNFNKLKTAKDDVASDTFVNDWCTDGKYPMFRKGTTDEWKNVFTVAQHEEFLAAFDREMKDFSYKLKNL